VRTLSGISHFLRARAGNVAIISALLLPVLVGFAGLGTETAWWYSRQREIQSAADIAAFGATLKRREGGTATDAKTVAKADAITNGWNEPIGTIAVNSPPTSGSYQNVQSVEVTLTENLPPFVSAVVFGNTPITVTAHSTATMRTGDPACILGLNPAAADTVKFWGNSSTSLFNCVVSSNSTSLTGFHLGGSADLTAPCAYSSGGASYDSGLVLTDMDCPAPVTNHPATLDPYVDVPAPPISGCTPMPSGTTLSPGCFDANTTFNSGTVNLQPGVYVINGGSLKINAGANLIGDGVMFYLTNGASLDISGNATLNLKAATSGTYSGLLFFGGRTEPFMDQKVNGTASSIAQGAFYFPSQKLTFQGNFAANQECLQIIANMVDYTGSATFQNNCAGKGVKDLTTVGNIKLVE
jgi:Flp pilus assembly protein TadG